MSGHILIHDEDRRLLLTCFAAVFGFGLAAHAYGFLNGAFSHDMLNALVADPVETYWKMQLGRPGIVLYRRVLRGVIAAPWQLGLLSLLWLSISCFLITRLFRMEGQLFPALLGGILSVGITTIAMTATYLYEMDADLFAVLLGVAAVFLWDRHGWVGVLGGAILTACCMGTYQSMVSVPVTLAMLVCMAALLRGERAANVIRNGLRALVMLGSGALLYWLGIRLMCTIKDINLTMDSYNSVEQAVSGSLLQRIGHVYQSWAWAFWNPDRAHIEKVVLAVNLLLPAVSLWRLAGWFMGRQEGEALAESNTSAGAVANTASSTEEGPKAAGPGAKLLLAVLLVLMPLGMNTAQLAFGRDVHDLMKYAFCFFYVLCLLVSFLLPRRCGASSARREPLRLVSAVLLGMLLCSHIQTANVVYTKKTLEQQAAASLMTRVLGRLEMHEDYHPGEMPLVFVGVSAQLQETIPGFERYGDITGCEAASPIVKAEASYHYNIYGAYFRYLLNNPAVMADWTEWNRLQTDPRVEAMPPYPMDGCMKIVDGVMVVKMGGPAGDDA